jgi:hypothetical protein
VHESLSARPVQEALSTISKTTATSPKSGSLWSDIADDMGMPTSTSLANSASTFFTSEGEQSETRTQSRPLNADEKTGLWLLLGLLAGGWIVGGAVNPRKTEKKSVKDAVADAKENAKEALH